MEAEENKEMKDEFKNGKKSSGKHFNVNPETFPLKVTLFLVYGAMSALWPYLTLHMQQIGISFNEIGVIYAVLPVTSVIGKLIVGILADVFGNYKRAVVICTVGSGLFHMLLVFVPSYQSGIPLNTTALVRLTPLLDQGFLHPVNESQCGGFNEVTPIGMILEIMNCSRNREMEPGELELLTHQFTLVEKFNCSARLDGVLIQHNLDQEESSSDNEITCMCNLTYPTGETTQIGSNQITFWVYFLIRIISSIFTVSSLTLLDATTLAIVKRNGKSEYGRERIWSTLGTAIASPVAGIIVDRVSHARGFTDYSSAFYASNALLVFGIISFFFIEFHAEERETDVVKKGLKLARYPEVLVFLVMITLLGILWGFVESYLFIFLKELEAPNYLLGFTLTVGAITSIPFLWGSEKIIAKFGRVNVIIAAFLTYFLRFFGYSYIQNPFWCLPFEAMEAITVHMMWMAAATYCYLLAPKGLLASLMSLIGSLHYSIGKGAGSLLGGVSYGSMGARVTFRVFGIAAGICGIFFLILDYFWMRNIVEKRLVAERAERDEEGGNEIEFRKISVRRRTSIFNANQFSRTTSVISVDEE